MWRFAKACVIGAAHERAGRACEDRVKVERIGRDVLVGAVADGAGSARRGGDGAPLWRSSGEGELRPLSADLEAAFRSAPIRERTHDDLSLVLATRRTVPAA